MGQLAVVSPSQLWEQRHKKQSISTTTVEQVVRWHFANQDA